MSEGKMRCEKITNLLSGYLDGELDGGERKLVEEHLRGCPVCSEELRVLRGCVESIGSLEEVEPPADFLNRVHRRLEEKSGLRSSLGKIFTPFPLRIPLEAAAAAAVVILVVYLVRRTPESVPGKISPAVTSFETRSFSDEGMKPAAQEAARPDSGLWSVRGVSAGEPEQPELHARAEKAEMVPREAAWSAPAVPIVYEEQAVGQAVMADAGSPSAEPAVELVLLIEPGTVFFGNDAVSRSRMKAAAARQLEVPEPVDGDKPLRADPPARLEDLVAREGGEIVSRETLADGTRRLVIKLPSDRYPPFRESLSRISDLPPAESPLPGEEPETFRFRLTAE